MLALFYFLGFLSGVAAAFVLWLIHRAKANRSSPDELGQGFRNILNF